MGFLDLFRRPPPIRDSGELAGFIDRQAAFIAQKGIYEYARARAGHYSKVLFREPEFQAACDVSRWQTYPLGLAMVAELVEGILLGAWKGERVALSDITDRFPPPGPTAIVIDSESPWVYSQHVSAI